MRMKRMNISLPDDLHEELQGFRQRINVSAVCQEAIRREVGRLKPTDDSVVVSDDVVDRLRAEKDELETTSRQIGFAVGTDWARRAAFRELRRWGTKDYAADRLGKMDTPPIEAVRWMAQEGEFAGGQVQIQSIVRRYPEFVHLPIQYSSPWDYPDFSFDFGDRASFNAGFLDAVAKFWGEVSRRL
jgi:hypothetical protein